jgi:hypothetical protein
MGLMLRAILMRWSEERVRRHSQVKQAGSVDANSVTRAAFEVAVRRRWEPGVDVREIANFVDDLRASFTDEIPALETQMLIREALGEDVPTSDIDVWREIIAKTATLGGIKDFLAWDEHTVNAVLVEAETIAAQRGYKPTLASSVQ